MMEPTTTYVPAADRYDAMTYNRCGDSGLKLPAVSLGCWHNFGDRTPFETMRQLTRTAFDHGVTHFDLANNYGPEPGAVERNGLKETSQRLGLGLITFSPLDQGLLTDRYLDGEIPADSRIAADGRFLHADALTEGKLKQIHNLNDIAAMRGQTLAEMALAWLLHDGAVTSVLVGASKPEQLLDNLKALENTTFTDRELSVIDFISRV